MPNAVPVIEFRVRHLGSRRLDMAQLCRENYPGQVLSAWSDGENTRVGFAVAWRWSGDGADQIDRAAQAFNRVVSAATATVASTADQSGNFKPTPVAQLPVAPFAFASFGFSPTDPGTVLIARHSLVTNAAGTWHIEAVRSGSGPDAPCVTDQLPARRGLDEATWVQLVDRLRGQLVRGVAQKVVLARTKTARFTSAVDARRLVQILRRDYPTCWTFAVDGLIGASPEMLAACEGTELYSRVLAGTAGVDEQDALRRLDKDREEHRCAVESVERALRQVATEVDVPAEPSVLELPNVTHLSTLVRAQLREPNTVFDAIGALHPTAAVCGTPRPVAQQWVADNEALDRGRYAGPVGWVDAAGNGEFALALRCAQLDPSGREAVLYAGAGIMSQSDPAAELVETEAKMSPMRHALRAASETAPNEEDK